MIKKDLLVFRFILKIHYPDIWWDTTNKEHYILGVDVKQGVSAWSLALLNELLLICEALTRDGQEDFSMSSQSANRENRDRRSTKVILNVSNVLKQSKTDSPRPLGSRSLQILDRAATFVCPKLWYHLKHV